MPLPDTKENGDYVDPERAARLLREAILNDKGEHVDSLAIDLTDANNQSNHKSFLCRLFGC